MVAESRPAGRCAEGLVVASRIEGELTQQRAVLGDDVDVAAGAEQGDGLVLVGAADGDVAEPAEITQSERSTLVVVAAEGVVSELQLSDGVRRGLLGEVARKGLVEALDLAAGVWVGRA